MKVISYINILNRTNVNRIIRILKKYHIDGNKFFQFIFNENFKRTVNGKKVRVIPIGLSILQKNNNHLFAQIDVIPSNSSVMRIINIPLSNRF
jgi:hypothetical protein